MKNSIILPLAILGALLLGACRSERSREEPASAVQAQAVHGEYAVLCGCSSAIGSSCGNYIQIDGAPLPIDKQHGAGAALGKMEWCGVDGAHAQVTGKIEDGKFMADLLEKLDS